MRSARIPFKQRETDAAFGSAMLYRAESLRDHFVVRWRGYKRASGVMWYSLGMLWEWWYDPASVENGGDT